MSKKMSSNTTNILLRNGFVSVPSNELAGENSNESLATVLMNLEYFGYCLSNEAFQAVQTMSNDALQIWWLGIKPEFENITGDDRNIGDFVVYKNFPNEVLEKSEAEYWIPQILMYWGIPNRFFTQDVLPREGMDPSERNSKTLMLASASTAQKILNDLLACQARWKSQELNDVLVLSKTEYVDVSKIEFKENLVTLVTHFIKQGIEIKLKTATDVLRLAAGLSGGDVSLREKVRFVSFNRKTRRFLMNMLESSQNLAEDVARRRGMWKRLFHQIHPGEFAKSHPKTAHVADDLYNDRLVTFNSTLEQQLRQKDIDALKTLSTRPGEFMRRLTHTLDIYGDAAVDAFSNVISSLSIQQIVSIRRHLECANDRQHRVFPPLGNWCRLQIGEPRPVDPGHVETLSSRLGKALADRVPAIARLDLDVDLVKLPNSGGDTGPYARGTTFKIPKDVTFIRTASYWRCKTNINVWFDNGWNFFDENWKSSGVICWNEPKFNVGSKTAAAFSGDPTNSKDAEGNATQVIDLYLDTLSKAGVRYAVWNVLCYSNIPFKNATDVFAALQWGADAEKGELFEPSRAQLSFPLTGDYKTKYVCVIDLKTKEMTYIDANLKANVYSASNNGESLSKQMPAFMEYIQSLPSVYDLFRDSVNADANSSVLYTDQGVHLEKDQEAYVFLPQTGQDFIPIDLNKILGM